MSSYPATERYHPHRGGGSFAGVAALLLGIALGVVVIVSVFLVKAADDARHDAAAVSKQAAPASAHDHTANSSLPLTSFAGEAAPNAEALAERHAAYPAALPAVPAGDLVKVNMTLKDMTVEIAPGVKYNTWAFDGHGAPGPVVHVREVRPSR